MDEQSLVIRQGGHTTNRIPTADEFKPFIEPRPSQGQWKESGTKNQEEARSAKAAGPSASKGSGGSLRDRPGR